MRKSGIIGNGFIAQKHKEAIKKMGWNYIGAYDVVPSKSEISLEKVLGESDIIHICTPNVFHHQLPIISPQQKFIIEKPVAISSDLVPDIPSACVCYQRRFDKGAQTIKTLCEMAKPNKIMVNILVPRDNFYWECWRGNKDMSGGGALMNIGIHYLDLLQWWLGNDYEILSADIGKFQRATDESASVHFDFNGTEVIFDLNARHNRRKIEYIAFWDDLEEHYIYDEETATHLDVFKRWEEGIYVDPMEAKKSLVMVENIYKYVDFSQLVCGGGGS